MGQGPFMDKADRSWIGTMCAKMQQIWCVAELIGPTVIRWLSTCRENYPGLAAETLDMMVRILMLPSWRSDSEGMHSPPEEEYTAAGLHIGPTEHIGNDAVIWITNL
jgi:hypothetical protein